MLNHLIHPVSNRMPDLCLRAGLHADLYDAADEAEATAWSFADAGSWIAAMAICTAVDRIIHVPKNDVTFVAPPTMRWCVQYIHDPANPCSEYTMSVGDGIVHAHMPTLPTMPPGHLLRATDMHEQWRQAMKKHNPTTVMQSILEGQYGG